MTPNPKAKVEEMDRQIARLAEAVEHEKTETKGVVDDLRLKLRHNRLLNSAIRSQSGASDSPPIPLPQSKP